MFLFEKLEFIEFCLESLLSSSVFLSGPSMIFIYDYTNYSKLGLGGFPLSFLVFFKAFSLFEFSFLNSKKK